MSATLSEQIQQFYDASSGLWEQIWGEHMHHGYYGADGTQKKDRRQAQIDLIEELLTW
ncbi:MAG: methyltransferase domain-containing protein, partial [Nostoc sp.]